MQRFIIVCLLFMEGAFTCAMAASGLFTPHQVALLLLLGAFSINFSSRDSGTLCHRYMTYIQKV